MVGLILQRDSRRIIQALALMTALVGVLDLITAITPAIPDSLEDLKAIYPLDVRAGAHVFAAFSSFLLINLAVNLLRRKRFAWFLVCLLLAGSIGLHLLQGVTNGILAINVALLLLLQVLAEARRAVDLIVPEGGEHPGCGCDLQMLSAARR